MLNSRNGHQNWEQHSHYYYYQLCSENSGQPISCITWNCFHRSKRSRNQQFPMVLPKACLNVLWRTNLRALKLYTSGISGKNTIWHIENLQGLFLHEILRMCLRLYSDWIFMEETAYLSHKKVDLAWISAHKQGGQGHGGFYSLL